MLNDFDSPFDITVSISTSNWAELKKHPKNLVVSQKTLIFAGDIKIKNKKLWEKS